MKKTLHISLFALFIMAVIAVFVYVYLEYRKQGLGGIEITVVRSEEKGFIVKDEIRSIIDPADTLQNQLIKNLELKQLELAIEENPFCEYADVFVNIKGTLVVNVKEIQAVVRVFNRSGKSFFIDDRGYFAPLSQDYTPRLLVCSGYFNSNYTGDRKHHIADSSYAASDLAKAWELSKEIQSRPFLRAQISQIYLNSKKEFDLVPLLGKHIIQFGKLEYMDEKLDKLEAFYKETLINQDWGTYKSINLKYLNQVVCTKK